MNKLVYELFYPFFFPFKHKKCWKGLWWLLLLDFIPIINLIILRGWRLELVSRIAKEDSNVFPQLRDIFSHLKKGCILWLMTFLYTLVPVFIIISIFGLGGIVDLIDDVFTLWAILIGDNTDSTLWEWFKNELIEALAAMVIEFTWVALSIPLYRAAMIRYSVTGKIRSFFNFPANILFIYRNLILFIKMYIFSIFLFVFTSIITLILITTVFGIVLIPLIMLPVYYWSTGYEYGHLARKLYLDQEKIRVEKQSKKSKN